MEQVKTIEKDGKTYYKAKDILNVLEIKNITSAIKTINNKNKHFFLDKTKGGIQRILFLTINGVKNLITKSRKPNAILLAEQFGIKLEDYLFPPIEAETLLKIKQAFNGEEMIEQFPVLCYRIDLYFPKYKLAIECDEHHHKKQLNIEADKKRQKEIEELLMCKFIRYDPFNSEFNIFMLLNKIFNHIKENNTKETQEQVI